MGEEAVSTDAIEAKEVRVKTVWEELGFPDHEDLTRKSMRLRSLADFLLERKMSTVRAMRVLGATAQEVGFIRRPRFKKISHERMEQLHARLPIASQAREE